MENSEGEKQNLTFLVDEEISIRSAFLKFFHFFNETHSIPDQLIISDVLGACAGILNDEFAIELNDDVFIDEWEEDDEEEGLNEVMLWKETPFFQDFKALRIALMKVDDDAYSESTGIIEDLFRHLFNNLEQWDKLITYHQDVFSSFSYYENDPLESGLDWRLMQHYVILGHAEKLDWIYDNVSRFLEYSKASNSIRDKKELYKDYKRYSSDIRSFSRIREFLAGKTDFPQKKIYGALSIDGRNMQYLFHMAEQLGVIHRKRHKESWLITLRD